MDGGDRDKLGRYQHELEAIDLGSDEVLAKGVRFALSLASPNGRAIRDAKALSKSGNHLQAAALYRDIRANGPVDPELDTSLAWEIYQSSKKMMMISDANTHRIKAGLSEYLKLKVDKPSRLHSSILQLASKLAADDKLRMSVFVQHWDLSYLRPEDFERWEDGGKTYPSLAEKIIQQAGKDAVSSGDASGLAYILPHVRDAVLRFPDGIWLKYCNAKVLTALGMHDDALAFGLDVAKSKRTEYWAWELLGDMYAASDSELAISCFGKALSCSADEKFIGKLRVKFAECLAVSGKRASAKYEIDRVISFRTTEGHKIPDGATAIASQDWYLGTDAVASNAAIYRMHAKIAESILFDSMPWISANVGEKFVLEGKDGKARSKRRLFLKLLNEPFEVSVGDAKFDLTGLQPGAGIQIKGEYDDEKRFQVYVVEKRDCKVAWDVFDERVGVVDHVNHERKLIHFIVDQRTDGIIPFSQIDASLHEGDAIAVRLVRYVSKQGARYRILSAAPTDRAPSASVRREFCESIRVDAGMGFTASDVFVPPPVLNRQPVEDGNVVSGVALLNYNKKRSSWGWKAISIEVVGGNATSTE